MAIDLMSAGGAVLDTTTAGAGDIKSGKTAYNGDGELVTGTYALPSTTAGASDILKDKTALDSSGSVITGTMVDQGAKTASLAPGGSYTIPAGYHNGSGKVTANSVSLSGNANAAQVLSGYTFYKDNYSTKLTGSMTNRGAVSTTVNPGGSYTIPAGYHNGSGKVYGGRSYSSVYLGQHSGYWSSFTYNVKSNYPSIYSKLSRSNFYAVPYAWKGNGVEWSGSGNSGDFISYNASTGVVTMGSVMFGTSGRCAIGVLWKLYMIY